MHNFTPLSEVKELPEIEDSPARSVPFFRFYLDGLIAHIHPTMATADEFGPMLLGGEEPLVIMTVTYEESYQRKNIANLLMEAIRDWPERMRKL